MVVAAILWVVGARDDYHVFWSVLGVDSFRFPFLDAHNFLASMQCHRQGIDVFQDNPCDVLNRPHDYSPLWLWLGDVMPVDTGMTVAAGSLLCLSFLAALFLLPPPRDRVSAAWLVAASVSSATAFAVERGNNDLLIFALLALAIRLALCGPTLRAGAYGAITLAALLKFYPLVAAAIALRERRVRFVVTTAIITLLAATFLAAGYRDIAQVLPNIPGVRLFYWDTFGAAELPLGISRLTGAGPVLQAALRVSTVLASWLIAIRYAAAITNADTLDALTELEALSFLIGSLTLCGCFYTGMSAYYRGIVLLFVLPALLVLGRRSARPAPVWMAIGCALFVLWFGAEWNAIGAARSARDAGSPLTGATRFVLWSAQQFAWWWLIVTLLAVTLAILRRLTMVSDSLWALFHLRRRPKFLDPSEPVS